MNFDTGLFARTVTGMVLGMSVLVGGPASAVPFSEIRIGDVDGFGFGAGAGLTAANGGAVNIDGTGVLQTGDFLPDFNGNGSVATGRGDDFDTRSAAEIAGTSVTCTGCTNTASSGSEFTDISLSTSYGTSSTAGAVHTSATTTGSGGPFPGDGDPTTKGDNQPGFEFRFDVAKADIVTGSTLFLNVVFGDYDVSPATLKVTKNNGSGGLAGSPVSLTLTKQPGGQDGLIQAAFATLGFSDVFSDGGSVWKGVLNVDFAAPNEPYTAFDYAELSLKSIPLSQTVPEPGTMLLLAAGLAGVGLGRRRRGAGAG